MHTGAQNGFSHMMIYGICMYIYIYKNVYKRRGCIRISLSLYIYIFIYIYIYIYIHMCGAAAQPRLRGSLSLSLYIYIFIYIYIYIFIYIHMCGACMHAYGLWIRFKMA